MGFAVPVGLIWGSFIGVLVDRVPEGRPFLTGRSQCDGCGRTLSPRDLIPVLSFVIERGRCRVCGASIRLRWTLMELSCAGLFALAALTSPDIWSFALFAPLLGLLLALTFIDLEHRRLPNAIVYPSLVAASAVILAGWSLSDAFDPIGALIGATGFSGGLLLVALLSRGGMGMGDVKLAALIGLIVGAVDLPSVGVAAGAAILSGGLVAIIAVIRGAGRRTAVPFGPMLAFGALTAVIGGPRIADAYMGLFT